MTTKNIIVFHHYLKKKEATHIIAYTFKNKGASKGSSSGAIEEPFLVPQRSSQAQARIPQGSGSTAAEAQRRLQSWGS